MTETEARAIFTLAGIEVFNLWQLPNGYHGPARTENLDIPRVYEEGVTLLTYPQLEFLNSAVPSFKSPWWLVKTKHGLIEIGWRKRVISIDWSDTPIRKHVTKDDVTKDLTSVHAWSLEKAVEYLKAFRKEPIQAQSQSEYRRMIEQGATVLPPKETS